MNPKTERQLPQQAGRRKNLVVLAGMLAIILISNGVISLFALSYSNENHLVDLQTLRQVTAALESARSAQVYFKKQVQEWKNILLRGSDPKDLVRYRAAFEEEGRRMDAELETLTALAQKLRLAIPEIEPLGKTHAALGSQYQIALQSFRPEDPSSAQAVDKQVRGIDRAPTDQMDAIVGQIQKYADEFANKVAAQSVARYRTLRNVATTGTAIGVIVVFIFLALSFAALPKE